MTKTKTEKSELATGTMVHGSGEFTKDDIIMPELKLSQGAGALGDWPKGQLVIDAEFEVEKAGYVMD